MGAKEPQPAPKRPADYDPANRPTSPPPPRVHPHNIPRSNLVSQLRRLVELQDELLVCYRMGTRPKQKTLDGLQRLRKATRQPER